MAFLRGYKKKKWTAVNSLTGKDSLFFRQIERLAVLQSAWARETAGTGKMWEISAVKGGDIFVKAANSLAEMELSLKSPSLIRNLNKYFKTNWIKRMRVR